MLDKTVQTKKYLQVFHSTAPFNQQQLNLKPYDPLFDTRQRLRIFLFATAFRPPLGPTQPPIQWVPGALSLGVKSQGREADHSPTPSAEFKNAWSYTFTPTIRLHGVVLS
jgi:hypothetical protein